MMYGPSRRQFLPWVTLLTSTEFLTKSELTTYVINPRQGARNYQGSKLSRGFVSQLKQPKSQNVAKAPEMCSTHSRSSSNNERNCNLTC